MCLVTTHSIFEVFLGASHRFLLDALAATFRLLASRLGATLGSTDFLLGEWSICIFDKTLLYKFEAVGMGESLPSGRISAGGNIESGIESGSGTAAESAVDFAAKIHPLSLDNSK